MQTSQHVFCLAGLLSCVVVPLLENDELTRERGVLFTGDNIFQANETELVQVRASGCVFSH